MILIRITIIIKLIIRNKFNVQFISRINIPNSYSRGLNNLFYDK